MLVFIWPQISWDGKVHVGASDHTIPCTGQLFSYFQQNIKPLSFYLYLARYRTDGFCMNKFQHGIYNGTTSVPPTFTVSNITLCEHPWSLCFFIQINKHMFTLDRASMTDWRTDSTYAYFSKPVSLLRVWVKRYSWIAILVRKGLQIYNKNRFRQI